MLGATPGAAYPGCDVKIRPAAAAGVMPNGALAPLISPALVAVRVYPEAALSILRPLNVATPVTALTVADHDSVAAGLPVPVVIETTIGGIADVTVLPKTSWTATAGCVLKAVPASPPSGCVVKTTL